MMRRKFRAYQPAARLEPPAERGLLGGTSEARELEVHQVAARGVLCALRLHAWVRSLESPGRQAVLEGMRQALADPEGCGSRYHHPVACLVLDLEERLNGARIAQGTMWRGR